MSADYCVWSPSCEPRGDTPVIWLAVHTAQGSTVAASLARFLAEPANEVSYHAVCDDTTTIQCVDYDRMSWSMLGGNRHADHLCCTGFAAWTREAWLAHPGMLLRIAHWLAERAQARGIPLAYIGPDGVANRARGAIGHRDYVIATHDGDHTDPGPDFPWDHVLDHATRGTEMPAVVLRLDPTSNMASPPSKSWSAVEETVTLPRGVTQARYTPGNGGAWLQEVWWEPGGQHIVQPAAPLVAEQFRTLVWTVPPGALGLVLRHGIRSSASLALD